MRSGCRAFIGCGGLVVRVVMSKQQGRARAVAPYARFLARLGICVIAAIGLLGSLPAAARQAHRAVASTAENAPVFEWILLDAETGQVLSEQNADLLTQPASLTKMMTLYLA